MYWKNSNFQNAFFVAGKQHTPDNAWIQLKKQLNDRELTLELAKADLKRREAKLNILNRKLWWARLLMMKNLVLQLEAELQEYEAHRSEQAGMFEGITTEIENLKGLMAALEPHRKYSHLSDNEAAQAAQREYWLHEMVNRAENFLITEGRIPHDHFAAMRSHPDYLTIIAPEVEKLYTAHRKGELTLASASKLNDSILIEVSREARRLLPSPTEA